MLKAFWLTIVAAALVCSPAHAQARRAADTVESGINVLKDSTSVADKGIPLQLLREAEAVAIIPDVVKVGFIGGVRLGRGVGLARDNDGARGHPGVIHRTGRGR